CENGWITPLPSYIDHHAPPMPADPGPDATADVRAAYEQQLVETYAVRAALTNAVYPCKTCRPEAFHRWAQGHYSAGHDPAGCAQCVQARKGSLTVEEIIDSAPVEPVRVPNSSDDDD